MTDYVAFDSDNSPISVYEYKNRSCEKDIFCICGKKLFFRDESVFLKELCMVKNVWFKERVILVILKVIIV